MSSSALTNQAVSAEVAVFLVNVIIHKNNKYLTWYKVSNNNYAEVVLIVNKNNNTNMQLINS